MADTKTFVDRGYNHARKQAKMDQEEEELKALEAEMRGGTPEEEEEPEEPQEAQVLEAQGEEDNEPEPDSPEERSFKKRYGDLRRHMQQKEKEWNDRLSDLESGKQIAPPKTDEDLQAWSRKYPDVAAIVETIASKKAAEMFSKADDRFKELDKAKEEAEKVKAETIIRKSHSDFDTLRDSAEFHDWAEAQPKWVQDALYENADDPASVVRVIDLYKVDNGMNPSAKKVQAKAAATATPRGSRSAVDPNESSKTFTESQVSKMSDKEFEKNLDAILNAQRSNKFVYDVTGGAR
jgi:hypothetical protein